MFLGRCTMKVSIELYANQALFIRDDSYIKLFIRSYDHILEESMGRDYYKDGIFILSEKRITGVGRKCCYSKDIHYFEVFQARPGSYLEFSKNQIENVTLVIQTNIILDPGLLKQQVGIRVVNEEGKKYDIPLTRPDIEIYWTGRGLYTIPLTDVLNNRLITLV